VVDFVHLAQQSADLVAGVAREVGANPAVEVGGFADVEDVARGIGEPVHARTVGEPGGELELGPLGVAHHPGEVEELLEPDDAEGAGPLQ
jgi:hypothetical protein